MEKVLIITGGSKGIGGGIVSAYLKRDYRIFSISRHKNPGYPENIHQLECDLSDGLAAEKVIHTLFRHLDQKQVEQITMINNAGSLGNIGPVESLKVEDIQHTVQLNTIAPLILTSAFLKLTESWKAQKSILNISSGAAKNPYFGWSIYCATKASLDMTGRVAALEQDLKENGTKIINVYPGVVDTGMQEQIRSATKTDFIDLEKFLDYKASGKLADAESVGEKIYRISIDPNIQNGSTIDVRDLENQ